MKTSTLKVGLVRAAFISAWPLGCLVACGGTEPAPQAAADVPPPPPPPAPPELPPPPPPPALLVTAGENGALPEGPMASVKILSPRADQVIKTGRVKVRLRVRNWATEAGGAHVHVIVDNNEYMRIDDPTQPIELPELAPGVHFLRAFPSRPNHESVKVEGAFSMVRFFVGARPAGTARLPRPNPTLTYSRPKGTYEGEAGDRVLLDFYLSDTELGPEGNRVHYSIDGSTEGDITAWLPHWIENLSDGQHTITLELRGPDNQPIPGPFNRTDRTITIAPAPLGVGPETPAAPHAGH